MWPLLNRNENTKTLCLRENKLSLVTIMENKAVYKNGQKRGFGEIVTTGDKNGF